MGHLHGVARRADRAVSRDRDARRVARDRAAAVAARDSAGSLFLAPFFYLTYGARQLARLAARTTSARSCSRWEHAHPVPRLDDHSVLVDQRVLRPVAVRLRNAGRARHAWPAPAHRADRRGRLLHSVSAALHFQQPDDRRPCRLSVRRAGELRPAVQPGAVAAHRAAGDPVGALRAHRAALGAMAAAHLVRAGRRRRCSPPISTISSTSRPARCSASSACGSGRSAAPVPTGGVRTHDAIGGAWSWRYAICRRAA